MTAPRWEDVPEEDRAWLADVGAALRAQTAYDMTWPGTPERDRVRAPARIAAIDAALARLAEPEMAAELVAAAFEAFADDLRAESSRTFDDPATTERNWQRADAVNGISRRLRARAAQLRGDAARVAAPRAEPTAAERWRASDAEAREDVAFVLGEQRVEWNQWAHASSNIARRDLHRRRVAALDALLALAREAEGGGV